MAEKNRNYLIEPVVTLLAKSRINSFLEDGGIDYSVLDNRLDSLLRDLGVTKNSGSDFNRDLQQYLGITFDDLKLMSSFEQAMEIATLEVFKNLIATEALAKLKHTGNYNSNGESVPIRNHIVNDVPAPIAQGFMCIYRQLPHYVLFNLEPTPYWHFVVSVKGKFGREFLSDLNREVEREFIAKYLGSTLNVNLKNIDLRTYKREDLVYPHKTGVQIDHLITCFKNWLINPKIQHWGYMLIGRPGTGKTTVGGLLAAARPKNCTFLYCPAAEINHPKLITRVFDQAKKLQPAVIQIDDVDLIARDRRIENARFTSTLMENLDGLHKSGKIFVLLTSNDVSRMDPALIGRVGRIGGKIVFDGFRECMQDLVALGRSQLDLNLSDYAIEKAIANLEPNVDLNPDEIAYVCRRLALLYGNDQIQVGDLVRELNEVYDNFHAIPPMNYLEEKPEVVEDLEDEIPEILEGLEE